MSCNTRILLLNRKVEHLRSANEELKKEVEKLKQQNGLLKKKLKNFK